MQNAKLLSYLHYHLIVFIWGFTAILGALISIEAIPLVVYRMGIAAVLIYGYVRIRKITLKTDRKTLWRFGIAGVLIALHWITFFGAIKIANVSVTLAVMSTGALFTALLEPLFYKRRFIGYELVFGGIVVAALYLIFEVETSYHLGIGLALISSLLSAIFTLINGKFAHQHNAAKISFYELLVGTLFLLVFFAFANLPAVVTQNTAEQAGAYTHFNPTALFPEFSLKDAFVLSSWDWVYIGILASICTAYAFIASVKVMKHLSPYTLMLTINLEPVYGIVLAYFIFKDKERMSPEFYYGAVVILLVVVANGILKHRKAVNS